MTQQTPTQVDSNFDAFVAQLPQILERHRGQYALLHEGVVIEYYSNALSAATEGHRKFGEGAYSVQEVTDESDNLGFYSYAGGTGQA